MVATKLIILSQNLCCKLRKQHTAIDTSFKLHGEFYTEKYSKIILWNAWNVLTSMRRRKKINMILPVHVRVGMLKSLPVPNA